MSRGRGPTPRRSRAVSDPVSAAPAERERTLAAWDAMPTEELDPRRWIALGIVLTAAFMVLLDISIVNVAIPSIQNNLHASFAQVQLVLAGYQMSYAVVLITGGRLGDINGRKRLFMLGMAGVLAPSASCGLAPSPDRLLVSPILHGLLAAPLYPPLPSALPLTLS